MHTQEEIQTTDRRERPTTATRHHIVATLVSIETVVIPFTGTVPKVTIDIDGELMSWVTDSIIDAEVGDTVRGTYLTTPIMTEPRWEKIRMHLGALPVILEKA